MHSSDPDADGDALAVTAASAALLTSSVPWRGPTAGVRVGWVDGGPVVFPTAEQMARSSLNMLYAGAGTRAIMLEVEARQLGEADMMAAIAAAHKVTVELIDMQLSLARRVDRGKRDVRLAVPPPALYAAVREVAYADAKGMFGAQKRTRSVTQGKIMSRVMTEVGAAFPDAPPMLLRLACDKVVQEALRDRMLESGSPAPGPGAPPGSLVSGVGSRPDGRDSCTVRPISGAVGILPRTHGSSLFTRGSTQVLVAATLGDPDSGALTAQSPSGGAALRKQFYLHYDFPGYCTNEVAKPGMNRRMVGHGALAERALAGVVMPPGGPLFPYAVRVSSEVTASDGSSSMATVCGATLALQDAGVPLAAPVAGVSVGLVTPRDMAADPRFLLLTDILGLEDHVGDMDFKVAGSASGVTAVQLDVKLEGGLPMHMLDAAFRAAAAARRAVLRSMSDVMVSSRGAVREFAPRTERVTLEASARGILVSNFSAVLRRLQDETGAKMAMDGHSLDVFGSPAQIARVRKSLAREIEEYHGSLPVVGTRTRVRVVVVRDFGALVEAVGGGAKGVVHVSELRHAHTARAADVIAVGDEFEAEILDVDANGAAKYSRKACIPQVGPGGALGGGGGGGDPGNAVAVRPSAPSPALVVAAPAPAVAAATAPSSLPPRAAATSAPRAGGGAASSSSSVLPSRREEKTGAVAPAVAAPKKSPYAAYVVDAADPAPAAEVAAPAAAAAAAAAGVGAAAAAAARTNGAATAAAGGVSQRKLTASSAKSLYVDYLQRVAAEEENA